MSVPKFDPKELEVKGEKTMAFGGSKTSIPLYNFPVTPKEACKALYRREPIWQISGAETMIFAPRVNPDNIARAMVFDGSSEHGKQRGGKDMFGIEWEFIPQVGGSMVRPGKPVFEDANDWKKKLVWPDIDAWDWKGNASESADYLGDYYYNDCWLQNGFFERLISFMDVDNALVALIDEDQKDAVKALFDRLSDLYIRIIGRFFDYFPKIDGMFIHDDWGSQKETFFAPETAAEMIVPYMKKVTDYIHSRGKFAELHSCGQLMKQVPNIAAAGWDSWYGQAMNDSEKMYELYGDRLVLGVTPAVYDPSTLTAEEECARARAYADKYCRPDKPSKFSGYGSVILTDNYRRELYRASRENYSK
jgi:hypothetical protein